MNVIEECFVPLRPIERGELFHGKHGTLTLLRMCSECEAPIPAARLKVMPNARQCVKCLEALGDVPLIRGERTVWPNTIAATEEDTDYSPSTMLSLAQEVTVSDILETVDLLDVEGFLWPAVVSEDETA